MGLNAIDVYYPWNYHSEKEGKYNFKGNRDVDLLMDEIEKAGLYLIARPGPYICSEIDAGGLPGWLIAKKDVIPRCRENGKFIYNEEFMKYTREWWEQIVPRIAKRKNLLLFQVENEYNLNPDFFRPPVKDLLRVVRTYSPESIFKVMNSDLIRYVQFRVAPNILKNTLQEEETNIYVKELYDWSREMGIKVPIFHNDIMSTAGRVTDVDIMAIDDYAITDFHEDWKEKKARF